VTLDRVQRFRVSAEITEKTAEQLRRAGDEGYELFVLWSGVAVGDDVLEVQTAHVPKQTSYRTSTGLLVRVEGDALHKLNTWLYDHHEMLAAQVHAHPRRAFHSDTDNTYPIVTTLGGLSIVSPNFARDGVIARGTAAFRLTPSGWRQIPRRALTDVVEVC
jgi:hypothetical protein